MPIYDTKCQRCATVTRNVTLRACEHPPCACGGDTEYLWTEHPSARFTDESFIGGQVIENLGHEPVTVYSRTELKQEMLKRGLEQRIKYVPGDHYLTDWSKSIDPYTLESAKALVSRQAERAN